MMCCWVQTTVSLFTLTCFPFVLGIYEVVEDISENLWNENDNLPIEMSVIEHLSKNLKESECQSVYAFLVIQDSASKMHKFVDLKTTSDYAKQLKSMHQNDMTSKENFNCLKSLQNWNKKLIGRVTKGMLDANDIVRVEKIMV